MEFIRGIRLQHWQSGTFLAIDFYLGNGYRCQGIREVWNLPIANHQ